MSVNQNSSVILIKAFLNKKTLLFALIFSMFHMLVIFGNTFIGLAQTIDTDEKKITREIYKNEPIEFVESKSNGKKLKFDEKFKQENDWLKDFTFEFKNVSGKSITYISLIVNFPETRSNGLPMSYIWKFGVHPVHPNINNDELKMVAPNEIRQMLLSPKKYEIIKGFLATRNHSLKDLTEANVAIQQVCFAEGTCWFGGYIYRPDPDRPGRYIPVDERPQDELK